MNTPQVITNSTGINKGDLEISLGTFIITNFVNSKDCNGRLHTEKNASILNDNGYKINKIEAGRLMNRISIGKYNDKGNVDKCRKGGYDYVDFLGKSDEV